jgi:hypothetical protein
MIVTEKEALAKRCPLARAAEQACAGSRCMAWRWVHEPGEIFQDEDGRNTSVSREEATGFCGLAYSDSRRH